MAGNVLLVDDDPDIQNLVKHYLEQNGYVVKVCGDGHSGLEELHTNPYDLMILDISMPHLNGYGTLQRVRANSRTKDLPVLMLTGKNDPNSILWAKKYKITDFVIKPPQKEDLLQRVSRILARKSA